MRCWTHQCKFSFASVGRNDIITMPTTLLVLRILKSWMILSFSFYICLSYQFLLWCMTIYLWSHPSLNVFCSYNEHEIEWAKNQINHWEILNCIIRFSSWCFDSVICCLLLYRLLYFDLIHWATAILGANYNISNSCARQKSTSHK